MTTEVIEQAEKELELVTIHESLLWDEDDPRRTMTGLNPPPVSIFKEGEYVIDMRADSYIWVYTGTRGAGKTTLMTLYALKARLYYGFRIVSNYDIECYIQRIDGTKEYVKSESLDLFKLLDFDDEYQDCLIIIDEAPDLISHMASMTWKNRLINIFARQIRKNHNNLFLGAQQFELIDKSFRWQVDILAECKDASRKYGWGSSHRGKCVLLRLLDNSGQWTGETWEEAYERQKNSFAARGFSSGQREEVGEDYEYFPRILWGEKDKTRPVFDSWVTQDVWESLRKVDLNIESRKVGEKKEESDYKQRAMRAVTYALDQGGKIKPPELYDLMGELTQGEKNSLGSIFRKSGVLTSPNGSYKDFRSCDREKLAKLLGGPSG